MRANAAQAQALQALAREKAAAVGIMRTKAANQIGTLAQDRLFGAYLNATTQSESERLKRRIESALGTINKRFGLSEVALIARGGTFVAHVATQRGTGSAAFATVKDAVLPAGFALDAMKVSTFVVANGDKAGFAILHVTPVIWHGSPAFVLRGAQDIGAYKTVLKSGVGAGRYVALLDESGAIISDTGAVSGVQGAPGKLTVAGFSFDAVRRAIKGTPDEGAGQVAGAKDRFNVGYQTVGPWMIVAVEPAAGARRCPGNGARLCG